MGEQPLLVGGRNEPAPVLAMQVMDDLGQNMAIAEWIHHSGGRVSDPLWSMRCAFTLNAGDRTAVDVQLGDVIAMVGYGVFVVLREVRPVTEPEEVRATLDSLGDAIDKATQELAARSGVPLELLSPRLAGADRHPWFANGVATLRPAVPQEGQQT